MKVEFIPWAVPDHVHQVMPKAEIHRAKMRLLHALATIKV